MFFEICRYTDIQRSIIVWFGQALSPSLSNITPLPEGRPSATKQIRWPWTTHGRPCWATRNVRMYSGSSKSILFRTTLLGVQIEEADLGTAGRRVPSADGSATKKKKEF